MSNERKLRRIVYRNLDKIYTTAEETAYFWDKKAIPLSTLKLIINRSKSSIETGNKVVDNHNEKYNKCLDSLYSASEKEAKQMDLKSISLDTLKRGIDIIKGAYR